MEKLRGQQEMHGRRVEALFVLEPLFVPVQVQVQVRNGDASLPNTFRYTFTDDTSTYLTGAAMDAPVGVVYDTALLPGHAALVTASAFAAIRQRAPVSYDERCVVPGSRDAPHAAVRCHRAMHPAHWHNARAQSPCPIARSFVGTTIRQSSRPWSVRPMT